MLKRKLQKYNRVKNVNYARAKIGRNQYVPDVRKRRPFSRGDR